MITILIVLVVLMLIGAIPTWPHSRNWGYGPSGGLGVIVLILLFLFLTGRLEAARRIAAWFAAGEISMSKRNGDRARFQKDRKRKMLRRQHRNERVERRPTTACRDPSRT